MDDNIFETWMSVAAQGLAQAARSPEQRACGNEGFVSAISDNGDAAWPVLAALEAERKRYDDCDEDAMRWLIDILVKSGVYPQTTPAMEKHGYDHLTMVNSWGGDWFAWREPINCSHCDANWRDEENGPPFKREIGIEVRGLYDGVAYWKCPDCGKATSRRGKALSSNDVENPTRDIILK